MSNPFPFNFIYRRMRVIELIPCSVLVGGDDCLVGAGGNL